MTSTLRSARALRVTARLWLGPLLGSALALMATAAGGAAPAAALTRAAQQASSACPVAPVRASDGYQVSTYVSGLPFDDYQVDERFGVAAGMCIGPFGVAFSGATAYVATSGSPGGLYRFGLTGGTASAAHKVIATPFLGQPVYDRGRLYIIENYADPQHASVAQVSPTTGQATALWATAFNGYVYYINLKRASPTAELVLTAPGGGNHLMSIAPGPQGCVYVTGLSTVMRLNKPGQTCS